MIHHEEINGISLKINDFENSVTTPFICQELRHNVYGLEEIALGPKDTFLDLGANVGVVSCYVYKKFKCRVIAVEPVPTIFNKLFLNLWENQCYASCHNYAVGGPDEEKVKIQFDPHRSGNSSEFVHTGIEYECPVLNLSELLKEPPTYLKIDVEGAEFKLIPQILPWLHRVKYIGIEIHNHRSEWNAYNLLQTIQSATDAKLFTTIVY
jgi:FkbM family methyltransferase